MSTLLELAAGFAAWLQGWQTLTGALVALLAAYIAFRNTKHSLNQAARLENNRRGRKHAAVRAVLPLALAQISGYAERSARALNELLGKCTGETLPHRTAPETLVQSPPTETLKTLADFIEYSDTLDVRVLEATAAWIQIHDSRVRGLFDDNRSAGSGHVIVRSEIEGHIIDAASIYAGAASAFDYARRREETLPTELSWDDVRSALRNMRVWEDEYPRVHEALKRREGVAKGPFQKIDLLNRKV